MKRTSAIKLPVAVMLVCAQSVCTSAQTRPSVQPARPVAAAKPAAAAPAEARADETVKAGEIVARVGTNDVTAEEVRAAIALMDPRQQAALARDPALLSQTVRSLLANRLVLKEAMAKKWDQQPAVVAQIARAHENVVVESYVQSLTTPPDSYPSDAEVKAVYEANQTALVVPRRFQLAQILVARDADKSDEAGLKKLDEVSKKLKLPGADFGAIARASSDDKVSAEKDGEIGWVAEPDLRPEIRAQVTGLSKSAISEPVKLDDGWHILKLLDTEPSRTRSLSEVRDVLVERMRAERAEANRRAYLADLIKQNPPVVNEIALSKVFDPKSGVPSSAAPLSR